MLIKMYKIDKIDRFSHGTPLLLSSINNWAMTRFVDVKIFSQLLKGEYDEFIENSIRKQQAIVAQELENSKESYLASRLPLKRKDSSMTMN